MMEKWDETKVMREISLLQRSEHFVVVDLTTTGRSFEKGAEIIEIAAIRVYQGVVLDYFHTFVRPESGILKWETMNKTGINWEHVQNAPSIKQAVWEFWFWLGELPIIVAHDAFFHWKNLLLPLMLRHGIPIKEEPKMISISNMIKKATHSSFKKRPSVLDIARVCGYTPDRKVKMNAFQSVIASTWSFLKILEWARVVDIEEADRKKKKKYTEKLSIKIVSLNHWKKVAPNKTINRWYINFKIGGKKGVAYYDINRHEWGVKDYTGMLPVENLEKAVLKKTGLSKIEDLETYTV